MKKCVFLTLAMAVVFFTCNAQLKYHSNGELTFGNASSYHHYTIRGEAKGLYFNWNSKFLLFDLDVLYPRIAGTGDRICFYNSVTSSFNSIEVSTVLNSSDRNGKTNIAPLSESQGLQTLMKLKPVTYDWKDPHNGLIDRKTGATMKNIGFIAQDIEEVLPQLVHEGSDGKKLMNYIGLIPILTKSIQELNSQVKDLEKQVAELKKVVGSNGPTVAATK